MVLWWHCLVDTFHLSYEVSNLVNSENDRVTPNSYLLPPSVVSTTAVGTTIVGTAPVGTAPVGTTTVGTATVGTAVSYTHLTLPTILRV